MANFDPSTRSSGDLIADRRFAWALAAADGGDAEGAADLLRQVLERVPDWASAWLTLGQAEEQLGQKAAAAQAYSRALACEPEDALGAGMRLALLDGATPARPPDAYVRELFDAYAARFEVHLTEGLAYRGPALLRGALKKAVAAEVFRFPRMLDLGCGTGLAGRLFSDCCDEIVGVDLAPAMVEATRRTGFYARAEAGDLVPFMASEAAASFDLVLGADVFVYVGALESAFAGIARVLRPNGHFAATVQSAEGQGYRLGDDLRYAHSAAYVADCAAGAGLRMVSVDVASFRTEKAIDVPGLVVVLARP